MPLRKTDEFPTDQNKMGITRLLPEGICLFWRSPVSE